MTSRVVVEGPDGAGKTNLIKRLVADTGLEVKPRASDSLTGAIPDIGAYIDDDLLNHGHEPGIFDRHPLISEMIYGPVIRGYMKFEDFSSDWPDARNALTWLMDRLELFYSYQPVLIYCLPPWFRVYDNVMGSEQMPGVKENIQAIYELYVALYARDSSRPRVHRWNFDQPQYYDRILRDVKLSLGDEHAK